MIAFISIVLAISMLIVAVYGLHKFQIIENNARIEQATPLPVLDDLESSTSVLSINKQSSISDNNDTVNNGASNWMDNVASLKAEERFDEAMQLCAQEFPLWSAYNQACIVLRCKLRSIDKMHSDFGETLEQLYNTAALAELIHEKSPDATRLSLHQLKGLDLSSLADLNFEYNSLGYANLRLIRKGDVKLLLSERGRPDQHQFPRTAYTEVWEQLSHSI